ncbi:AraC family transcriptional regulator [Kribbella speibonae]|uniref:AraC family transcriptional regulator n=1 Tax=Kribbella speibonae TaxID=1572660 RepID=A0ABY2AB53_9ACTN|nr:AraC family transcriptional regulator [Kribbella speibonae]
MGGHRGDAPRGSASVDTDIDHDMHCDAAQTLLNMVDLDTCMYFFAVLTLDGYLLAPRRSSFSLASDTYETWSLLLPRSGAFAFEVVGVSRGVARFGDIVICPPGGTLRRTMRSPMSFFHARFSTELDPPTGCRRVRDLDRLRADLKMLEATDAHPDLVAAHVVTDLVLMTLRAHHDAPGDELVERATAAIHDHFTAPDLSLGGLANALGISPAQLSRRFKAVHGVTPVLYLRRLRMRKARELLAETDDTLQAVAEHCGYRSAFYLSRVFSQHTGQSPSRYRAGSRV